MRGLDTYTNNLPVQALAYFNTALTFGMSANAQESTVTKTTPGRPAATAAQPQPAPAQPQPAPAAQPAPPPAAPITQATPAQPAAQIARK